MKGATPVPGPTIMMGAAGSSGKRKECVARGEISIWNIEQALVSAKTTRRTRTHLSEYLRVPQEPGHQGGLCAQLPCLAEEMARPMWPTSLCTPPSAVRPLWWGTDTLGC